MRKLFLASFACVSLGLIKEILPASSVKLKAAVIPTAADPYERKDFVDADRTKLVEMGFLVKDVDLKNKSESELERELTDVDLILMAGGNTFYLLDHIRKSGFDKLLPRLLDRGAIYVGSSAGSIVCCPTIIGARLFDDPKIVPDLIDYSGLNLFDTILLPHSQKEKYFERLALAKIELKKLGLKAMTLSDDEAIMIVGDEVRKVSI